MKQALSGTFTEGILSKQARNYYCLIGVITLFRFPKAMKQKIIIILREGKKIIFLTIVEASELVKIINFETLSLEK